MIPKAISESFLKLGDITIRCYVLEDGNRVVNAEDIEAFLNSTDINISIDEMTEFVKFLRTMDGRI